MLQAGGEGEALEGRQALPVASPAPLSVALCPWHPGLRSPVISIDPPSSTVQQGQDASFKCLIHEGATPINLEWKARNHELEGEPAGVGAAPEGCYCRQV